MGCRDRAFESRHPDKEWKVGRGGLRHRSRKPTNLKGFREFESHTFRTIEAWCNGSIAVSKTADGSSNLSAPASAQVAKRLTRRSAKPVSAGPNPALSSDASLAQLVEHLPCKQRVAGSIPVGGSSFICIFAPAKTILDMAQTFFFTTCWRNSMSFAGCVMSEKRNRHHIERISSRPERS